jgi:hypothetical protein
MKANPNRKLRCRIVLGSLLTYGGLVFALFYTLARPSHPQLGILAGVSIFAIGMLILSARALLDFITSIS